MWVQASHTADAPAATVKPEGRTSQQDVLLGPSGHRPREAANTEPDGTGSPAGRGEETGPAPGL